MGEVGYWSLAAKALSDLNELDGGLQKEEEEAGVGLGVVEEIFDGKATGGKGVLQAIGPEDLPQGRVAVCGVEHGVAPVLAGVLVAALAASGSVAGLPRGRVCSVHVTRVGSGRGWGKGQMAVGH